MNEGIVLCGAPPRPGDVLYSPDGDKYLMLENGVLDLISKPVRRLSLREKVVSKFFCGACLIPRFVPGHKFRGCDA